MNDGLNIYTIRAVAPSGDITKLTYCVQKPAQAKAHARVFVARMCQCAPERIRIASCRKER